MSTPEDADEGTKQPNEVFAVTLERVTLEQFRVAQWWQDQPIAPFRCFVCPCCQTVQCAEDFRLAGAGSTYEEVYKFVGVSCVGRWTGADAPRKEPDGRPCNLTLGGVLKLHDYEVILPDGEIFPHFRPATHDQTEKHLNEILAMSV